MPLQPKVKPGDSLATFKAETFNTFLDVAAAHQRRQNELNRQPVRDLPQPGIIRVRNDTGDDLDQYAVVGLGAPIIDPDAESEIGFQEFVALAGETPAESHRGRFAVLLEPLPDGQIGRALISGATAGYVQVAEGQEGLQFADIDTGDAGQLAMAEAGSAQVLWKQSGTGRRLAYLRISNPQTLAEISSSSASSELPSGSSDGPSEGSSDGSDGSEGSQGSSTGSEGSSGGSQGSSAGSEGSSGGSSAGSSDDGDGSSGSGGSSDGSDGSSSSGGSGGSSDGGGGSGGSGGSSDSSSSSSSGGSSSSSSSAGGGVDNSVDDCGLCPDGAPQQFVVRISGLSNSICGSCAGIEDPVLDHQSGCTWSYGDSTCGALTVTLNLDPGAGPVQVVFTIDDGFFPVATTSYVLPGGGEVDCLGQTQFDRALNDTSQCSNWPASVIVEPAD